MNTLINQPTLAHTVAVESNSLRLSDQITDEEIAQVRNVLEGQVANINWIVGDFYSEVARVRPTRKLRDKGEQQLCMILEVEDNERVRAMVEDSVQTQSSQRAACRVAEILKPGERYPLLSWGHHSCVLEEFNLLGGAEFDRVDYQACKAEALTMLAYVDRERASGNLIPVNELRKILRMRNEVEDTTEEEPLVVSVVGDVMRELYKLNRFVKQISVGELGAYDRTELLSVLKPLAEFKEALEAQ